MEYRKYRAQKLFDGENWYGSEKVLILNSEGVVLGVEDLQPEETAIPVLEGILCPGFINTHCHLELSHLKGKLSEKTGMVGFIKEVMTKRSASHDDQINAMNAAIAEMKAEGIVAVGDICNTGVSASVKLQTEIVFHNFIEISGFVPAGAKSRYEAGLEVLQQFKAEGHSEERMSLVPHAPYSVSAELFKMIQQTNAHPIQTMHSQESSAEEEWIKNGVGDFKGLFEFLKVEVDFFKGTGLSSLQYSLPFFTNEPLILVHNGSITKEDIDELKSRYSQGPRYCCLCPNANEFIGNQVPDINLLRNAAIPITIGTDSLASNHQLSIRKELQKLKELYPNLPSEYLVEAATSNGAKALKLDEQFGAFKKHRKPGVNLIAEDFSQLRVIA